MRILRHLLVLGWIVPLGFPVGAQTRYAYSQDDLNASEVWSLGAPDLSIGLGEGDEEYLLAGAGSVQALGDGNIAITNFLTAEVRVFSPSGEFVRAMGGQGAGPGEFLQIVKLFRMPGDSLATWDIAQARGPIYAESGEYGRQIRAPEGAQGAFLLGVFGDGSFLLATTRAIGGSGEIAVRRVHPLIRLNREGEYLDSIGVMDGIEMVQSQELGYVTNVTFSPQGFAAAGRRSVWLVDGRSAELVRLGWDGRVIAIASWEPGDLRVSEAETEAFWATYEARGEEFVASAKERRKLPVAEFFPATGRVFVDAVDRVWVQRFPKPSEPHERWLIFNEHGRLTAQFVGPDGFSLRDVVGQSAYGIVRDEWDVERVERRPIVKSRGGGS